MAQVLQRFRPQVASHKILLIEDHSLTREMWRRALAREGWQLAEAENGQDALALLTREIPGLILLDLLMPKMNGFEFMEELLQAVRQVARRKAGGLE